MYGFAPNSQGRRVWSITRTSLNVMVKGQCHREKNALSTAVTPGQHTNGMHSSLQTVCSSSRRHNSIHAGGWLRGLVCDLFGKHL